MAMYPGRIRGAWLAGLALAGVAWWGLARLLPSEHQPTDGIVGTPAFQNYSEPREKALYVAAHVLAIVCCGLACVIVVRRSAHRRPDSRAASEPSAGRATEGGRATPAGSDDTTPADDRQVGPTTIHRRTRTKYGWGRGASLAIVIYACFAWVAANDAPFDIFHEGTRLNYAQAALEGKLPYRDFDCTYGLWYGVGQHLAAFKLFGGVSAEAARRLGHLLVPLLPVAMYFVCWAAVRRHLEACAGLGLATLLIFAPPILTDWVADSQAFTTRHAWAPLLVGLVLLYLHSRRSIFVWLAGAGGAVACLWPLQAALVPAGAVVGTLALLCVTHGWGSRVAVRALVLYAAGLACGLIPLAAYLAHHGALIPFLQYHAKLLQIHASWNGQPFLPPLELIERHGWHTVVYLYLPPLLTCASAGWLAAMLAARCFTTRHAQLACLTLAGFAQFFAGAVDRSDGVHGACSSFMHVPLLLLLPMSVFAQRRPDLPGHERAAASEDRRQKATSKRTAGGWLGLTARVGLAVALLFWSGRYVALRVYGFGEATQSQRGASQLPRLRNVLLWSKPDAAQLDLMGQYIFENTSADQAILDLSDWFSAYFLYDRPAPGRFYFSYDAVAPADQEQICGELRSTEVVIFPLRRPGIDGIPPGARYHVVMEHVLADFDPDFELAGYVVMRPRRQAGQATRRTDWLRLAPRREDLGFLPYFGSELFATRAAGHSVGDGGTPTERPPNNPAPAPAQRAGGAGNVYLLSVPGTGSSPRLVSLEIKAASGGDAFAWLGWSVDCDGRLEDFAIRFRLVPTTRPHTYVVKLGSLPQWVWAKEKLNLRLALPGGATLMASRWQ